MMHGQANIKFTKLHFAVVNYIDFRLTNGYVTQVTDAINSTKNHKHNRHPKQF